MNFYLVNCFQYRQTDGQTEGDAEEPTVHEHRWVKNNDNPYLMSETFPDHRQKKKLTKRVRHPAPYILNGLASTDNSNKGYCI